jgi:flagellar protein FliO/FliZ
MSIGINSGLTALAALAAVLMLIWLAGRLARFGGIAQRAPGSRILVVRDVLALDARRRLHLIECEKRRFLLLTGGAQDVVVGWLDPPDKPPCE